MNSLFGYRHLLRCPDCFSEHSELLLTESGLACSACNTIFPVISGRPVLLKKDNPLFPESAYLVEPTDTGTKKIKRLENFIPKLSVNMAVQSVLPRLITKLRDNKKSVVLVVGGGTQRSWLDQLIDANESLVVLYSDIDVSADVDLICDGHVLPFKDGAFDAVITTAVLEHVLYPETVAKEIHRTLKVGGLLYSELPFMQQVHEGAYDFTRYTLSGHRRLFNYIEEIESGMVAGPGTALAWSIENFALALASRRTSRLIVKILSRLFFSWFKYFDYLLKNSPQAMDSASCTYIYGRRSTRKVTDREIVDGYVGAKHLSHT